MAYLKNILIGLDQLGTTLVGGYPDETLSSYAYRMEREGKVFGAVFRPVIDWLFYWPTLFNALSIPEPLFGHCLSSYMSERLRAQLPPELR